MPKSHLPQAYQIKQLMDSMESYKRQFKIQTGYGEKKNRWG